MATTASLTEPAKLLLLSSILSRSGIISSNGKAFLKVGVFGLRVGLGPSIKENETHTTWLFHKL